MSAMMNMIHSMGMNSAMCTSGKGALWYVGDDLSCLGESLKFQLENLNSSRDI